MKLHMSLQGFLRDAMRSVASPTSREIAELTLWSLLALIALVLVLLPGDQVLGGIEWLIRCLE